MVSNFKKCLSLAVLLAATAPILGCSTVSQSSKDATDSTKQRYTCSNLSEVGQQYTWSYDQSDLNCGQFGSPIPLGSDTPVQEKSTPAAEVQTVTPTPRSVESSTTVGAASAPGYRSIETFRSICMQGAPNSENVRQRAIAAGFTQSQAYGGGYLLERKSTDETVQINFFSQWPFECAVTTSNVADSAKLNDAFFSSIGLSTGRSSRSATINGIKYSVLHDPKGGEAFVMRTNQVKATTPQAIAAEKRANTLEVMHTGMMAAIKVATAK